MSDEDILSFLDEEVPPEELDKRITEELRPQSVVVLPEDTEQRTLLHGLVRGPAGDAREEDDEHLVDALRVKEVIRHTHLLAHECSHLLNEFSSFQVLEPFHCFFSLKLLSEGGSESSQNWLVERINLD